MSKTEQHILKSDMDSEETMKTVDFQILSNLNKMEQIDYLIDECGYSEEDAALLVLGE